MSGSPAAAISVGSQSSPLTTRSDRAGLDVAGPADHRRDRNAPSQLEFFSLRKGVIAAMDKLFGGVWKPEWF